MEGNTSKNVSDFDGELLRSNAVSLSPVMVATDVIVGTTGALGNMLVVIVFIKHNTLFHNLKTTFIVNQSVIDGIVSLLLILTRFNPQELDSDADGLSAELYCRLWLSQFPLWGLMTSSTYNLMAVSTERYLAIVHPIWHKVSFTRTKANILVVCTWLFGISFEASLLIPSAGMSQGSCFVAYFWPSRDIARLVASVQMFVKVIMPILVHFVCYARILCALRKRMTNVHPSGDVPSSSERADTHKNDATPTKKMAPTHDDDANSTHCTITLQPTSCVYLGHDLEPSVSTSNSQDMQQSPLESHNEIAKRNVVKTFAIVTACFFICYMPNRIYIIMSTWGIITVFGNVFNITVIRVFLNCCIKPIIYIGKYDAFRMGLSMLFRSFRPDR